MPHRATRAAALVAAIALLATVAVPAAGVALLPDAGTPAAGAGAGAGAVAAADAGAPAHRDAGPAPVPDAPDPGAVRQAVDPDAVVLRFGLRPDGDAAAAVEYRVRLATDDATAAFEDLQAAIRANRSTYEARFSDRMGRTVEGAENATGRPMALRNVTVETGRSFGGEYGVVTYRFEWTAFARANATHLVAGDALEGLFLDGETSLLVGWPTGYRRVAVAPPADDARPSGALWSGPLEFAPGEPRVVVTNASDATETPASPGTGTGPPDDGPRPGSATLVAVVAVVAIAAAIAVVATAWWRRRRGADGAAPGGGDGGDPPAELLSNEEQVLHLLEAEGGRVKQQDVVSALDWTEAKTSQVLGTLREEEKVEVFRIGRENVVTLPDEEL